MSTFASPFTRSGLACAAFVLSACSGAHAQMGGPPGGGMGRGRPPGMAEGGREPRALPPREDVADQLFQVNMRLLLAKEQAPAWERFRSAFVAMRKSGPPRPGADARLDATQAMQLQLGAAQNRYARMEDLADALRALLATLDEKQRQAADEVLPRLLLESPEGNRP